MEIPSAERNSGGCLNGLPGIEWIGPGTGFARARMAVVGQAIARHARLVHGGRTTRIRDADVVNETTGKPVALFRGAQLVLYPRA